MEATNTTNGTTTMRAIAHTRFAAPADALSPEQVPVPSAGPGQVLVRVHAAGIAIGDWLTITGVPYVARPLYGLRTPKQPIAGLEMAGTVEAVGPGVERFAVGDAVFGPAVGSFAEFVTADADALAAVPVGVELEQAAMLPVSGLAALQAVRDAGGVKEGDRVLVIGASGAVGTFAVQIAKSLGATVTAVVGTPNVDLVRAIGADDVIDYRTSRLGDHEGTFDVIIDLAGNTPLREVRSVLADDGTLAFVGGSGGRFAMGYGRTIRAAILGRFGSQTMVPMLAKPNTDDLVVLADLVASGDLTPVLDRSFPLESTVEAMEYIGARHTRGKSVITV